MQAAVKMAKSNATVFTMSPPAPAVPPTAPRRPWFSPVAHEQPQGACETVTPRLAANDGNHPVRVCYSWIAVTVERGESDTKNSL